jgi:hypothetical protein
MSGACPPPAGRSSARIGAGRNLPKRASHRFVERLMPLRMSLILESRLSVFLSGIAVGTIGTFLALNLVSPGPGHMAEDFATVASDDPTSSTKKRETSSAERAPDSPTQPELSNETPTTDDEFSTPVVTTENFEFDVERSATPGFKPSAHVAVPVSDARNLKTSWKMRTGRTLWHRH